MVKGKKILIEYQGLHHYQPVNYGGNSRLDFDGVKRRDKIKKDWCETNGYKLIIIPYWDFDKIETTIEREVPYSTPDRGRPQTL